MWLAALSLMGVLFDQPSRDMTYYQNVEAPVYVIGLVGQMGSGKTTAAKWLSRSLGCTVVNADELGHAAYEKGTPCYDKIVSAFGPRVLRKDGAIDRKALGAIVFRKEELRRKLEGFVWPEIAEKIEGKLKGLREDRRRYQELCSGKMRNSQVARHCVVLEAAVAVQAGWTRYCDEVWVIDAGARVVNAQRLTEHRNISRRDAERRLAAQEEAWSDKEFGALKDRLARDGVETYRILNTGSIKDFQQALSDRWVASSTRVGQVLNRRCLVPFGFRPLRF